MSAALRRDRAAVALLIFAVAGTAISAYLTALHYADAVPVCTARGPVDCAGVLQSRWSTVPGTTVPVTVPGLLWFLVSGGLAAVALRVASTGAAEPRGLRAAHVLWASLGMVAVFYFVYAEMVELHRICEWCTAIHLLVLASLLAALLRLQPAPAPSPLPRGRPGVTD